MNRPGIFATLWEEGLYDYSKQKYLDVIIRSLRETLKGAGIEEILEIKSGFLRVRTELLDCDLYRFLKNDPEAVNAYRGGVHGGIPLGGVQHRGPFLPDVNPASLGKNSLASD